MFVPGVNVTAAVQFVQLFAVDAFVQTAWFNEKNTCATATLSVAVPITVNAALLTTIPAVTFVMVTPGFVGVMPESRIMVPPPVVPYKFPSFPFIKPFGEPPKLLPPAENKVVSAPAGVI